MGVPQFYTTAPILGPLGTGFGPIKKKRQTWLSRNGKRERLESVQAMQARREHREQEEEQERERQDNEEQQRESSESLGRIDTASRDDRFCPARPLRGLRRAV